MPLFQPPADEQFPGHLLTRSAAQSVLVIFNHSIGHYDTYSLGYIQHLIRFTERAPLPDWDHRHPIPPIRYWEQVAACPYYPPASAAQQELPQAWKSAAPARGGDLALRICCLHQSIQQVQREPATLALDVLPPSFGNETLEGASIANSSSRLLISCSL